MKNNFKYLYLIGLLIPLTVCYLGLFLKNSQSPLLNTYPFISDDGYDWITEGIYLKSKFLGLLTDEQNLAVVRPPVYVFITAVDSFFKMNGLFVAIVNVLATLGTGIISFLLLKKKSLNFLEVLLLVVALFYTPINYVRFWLLSDCLAVFLGLVAFYGVNNFIVTKNQQPSLLISTLIALSIVLAGLCQTYAMIPALLSIGFLFLKIILTKESSWSLGSWLQKKRPLMELLKLVVTTGVIFVLALWSWQQSIPHQRTPMNFSLIKINFNMFTFYKDTWSYYFFPFLSIFYLLFKCRKEIFIRLSDQNKILFLIIGAHLLLVFFYQWPESRFSFLFWPYFIILMFNFIFENNFLKNKFSTVFFISFLFIQCFLSYPDNEWQPSLSSLTWGKGFSIDYSQRPPVTRFPQHCFDNKGALCSSKDLNNELSPYIRETMGNYFQLQTKMKSYH